MERKRSPAQDIGNGYHGMNEVSFTTASSSSSASARRVYVRSPTYPPMRSSSPPASAYFSHFTGDHHGEPVPTTPDASAHFAYSTTLRRHHVEQPLAHPPTLGEIRNVVAEEGPSGLWQRLVQTFEGLFSKEDSRGDYERLPSQKESKDTPSARFAHCSIEVSSAFIAFNMDTPLDEMCAALGRCVVTVTSACVACTLFRSFFSRGSVNCIAHMCSPHRIPCHTSGLHHQTVYQLHPFHPY